MSNMKIKGRSTHRFNDNPEEERFAKAWNKQNDEVSTTLAHLLDPHHGMKGRPPEPTDDQHVVAATVVQWLGSPVGQAFLRDLGYGRVDHLIEKIEEVAPYVEATLGRNNGFGVERLKDWYAFHAGRAESSRRQIEGLRKLAEKMKP